MGLVRTENQDFAILSSADDLETAGRGRLMVVADGMGGHRGGATASRMAATIIKHEYLNGQFADPPSTLQRALALANQRIFEEAQSNPDLRGMGTTCSALVIRGEEAWFAHVGDSRIYLVRDDAIRQLTQDHSLVASMVREGLITPQEAEVHPRRNVLQRSMGVIPEVEIDVSPALTVQAGDIYILCSDGLHGLVRDTEMKEVAKMPLEAVTAEFVRLAIERGAHDNVTVVVAHVEPDTGEPLVEPPVEPIPLEPIPPTVEMPVAVMAPPEGGDVTVMGPLDLSSTAAEILRSGRAAALPAAEETRKAPPVAPARNNGRLLTWFLLGLIVVASAIAIIYVATQDQRVPRSAAPATQR